MSTEQNMSMSTTKRLYVSGLRDEHTEEMLKKHFGQFGAVTKVEIITDRDTGKSRGFGYITFNDYDPVDRCVLLKSHMIHGFRCDVNTAPQSRYDEMQQEAQQRERDRMERGTPSRDNQHDGGGYGRGRLVGVYGQQYGGGGHRHGAPPPSAWGPPPTGPPSWGYGQYSYGQQAPAQLWAPTGAGPQTTQQSQWAEDIPLDGHWAPTPLQPQWSAGVAAAPVGAGTSSQPPASASGGQPSANYGNRPAASGPQGVPPPALNWWGSRY